MARFGSLAVIPWILFAQSSWDMDVVPAIHAMRPQAGRAAVEFEDRGEIFGHEATVRARESLQNIHLRHRASVLVETVQSLNGAWVADVAQRRARMVKGDRLYILVAGNEREVGVVGARYGTASRLTDQHRETIRRAFLHPLQEAKPVEAIDQGLLAIGAALDAAAWPTPGVQEAVQPGAILLACLLILVAFWLRWWKRGRGKPRSSTASCAARGEQVCDRSSATPSLTTVARAVSREGYEPESSQSTECDLSFSAISVSAGCSRPSEAR